MTQLLSIVPSGRMKKIKFSQWSDTGYINNSRAGFMFRNSWSTYNESHKYFCLLSCFYLIIICWFYFWFLLRSCFILVFWCWVCCCCIQFLLLFYGRPLSLLIEKGRGSRMPWVGEECNQYIFKFKNCLNNKKYKKLDVIRHIHIFVFFSCNLESCQRNHCPDKYMVF